MKVLSDGKTRTIKGAFPKKFKLMNNGTSVPFLRTGADSIRISGEIPYGELDVIESAQKKTVQPAKLDVQSLAIINKADFDKIDQLNKRLSINQEQMNAQMLQLTDQEAKLATLETQNATEIQKTNQTIVELAKEIGNEIRNTNQSLQESIGATQKISQETDQILSETIKGHLQEKNPHKITKATIGLDRVDNTSDEDKPISKKVAQALEKKAEKSDLAKVSEKLSKLGKKQSDILNGLNTWGGVGTGSGSGSGTASVDDITIKYNELGQIEAHGLIEKNQNKYTYDWVGTLKQYNEQKALGKIKSEWICYITDDWQGATYEGGFEWGDIDGTLSNQTDLQQALDSKQGTLTAGTGIDITGNVISCTFTNPSWGTITGDITAQEDLQQALSNKYDSSNPSGFVSATYDSANERLVLA